MKKIILIILGLFSILKVSAITETEINVNQDISYYIERIEELEKANKKLVDAVDVYSRDATVKRAEVATLKKELETYKNELSESKTTINQLIEEKNSISKSVEEYNILLSEANSKIDNYEESVSILNEELEENTKSKEELQNELENYKYLLEESVKEKSIILTNLEDSTYLVDKKNLEIKELVEYQDSYTDNIVNDLNSCYTENKILKDEKKVLKEEKEIKQSSLYYILIILILTVILTICRIMSSKNNHNFCRK